MEKKIFNTFKEAAAYARDFGVGGVKVCPADGKFVVVASWFRPLTNGQESTPETTRSRPITPDAINKVSDSPQKPPVINRPIKKIAHQAPQKPPVINRPIEKIAHQTPQGLCIDCQKKIPEARLAISPNAVRCVSCQSAFEKTHDTRPKINEGLAGTREENKRMRGQIWGEIRGRSRGGK